MKIEAKEFIIIMSQEELWNTAFDIRNALTETLKVHWVNHQNDWRKNEEERLVRMKTMFTHLGRQELYEDVFTTAKDIFDNFNKINNKS